MEMEIEKNEQKTITPFKYFLVTDSKGNKDFCITHNKKVKLGKKNIDLTFFLNKNENSFWEIDGGETKEISSKEYFKENLCTNILIKSRMKKLNMRMKKF